MWPAAFHKEQGGEYVRKMAEKLLQLTMPDRTVSSCIRVEDSVLWECYVQKRREMRERMLIAQGGAWQEVRGRISAGEDMMVETMTVEEAKVLADALPGCAGFCHKGHPTKSPVEIFFKSLWDITVYSSPWTSYKQKSEIKPKTSEYIGFSANTTLDHFVNEVWLLHGTSQEGAEAIVQSNFRLPGLSGCFGKGIYFGEDAVKCDQYAKPVEEGDHEGSKVMLLCRVILGNVYHIEHGTDRDAERLVDDPDFDSVVGVAHKHREFLVYDVSQVFPEYIFHYSAPVAD